MNENTQNFQNDQKSMYGAKTSNKWNTWIMEEITRKYLQLC